MSPLDQMQNKTCLVTGANSGIGLETSRKLAVAGATVIMCARNKQKGEAALADIQKSTGSKKLHLLLADLADLDQVRQLAVQAQA